MSTTADVTVATHSRSTELYKAPSSTSQSQIFDLSQVLGEAPLIAAKKPAPQLLRPPKLLSERERGVSWCWGEAKGEGRPPTGRFC